MKSRWFGQRWQRLPCMGCTLASRWPCGSRDSSSFWRVHGSDKRRTWSNGSWLFAVRGCKHHNALFFMYGMPTCLGYVRARGSKRLMGYTTVQLPGAVVLQAGCHQMHGSTYAE